MRHCKRVSMLVLSAALMCGPGQAGLVFVNGDFDGGTTDFPSHAGNTMSQAEADTLLAGNPKGLWVRSGNGHHINVVDSSSNPVGGTNNYITPPDSSSYAGMTSADISRSRTLVYLVKDDKSTTGTLDIFFDMLNRGPDPDLAGTDPTNGTSIGSVAGMEVFGVNGAWDGEFSLFNQDPYDGNYDFGFEYTGTNAVSLGGMNIGIKDEITVANGGDTEANRQASWQTGLSVTADFGSGYDYLLVAFGWGSEGDTPSIEGTTTRASHQYFGVDNVRVPEPSAILSLALAGGLIAVRRGIA